MRLIRTLLILASVACAAACDRRASHDADTPAAGQDVPSTLAPPSDADATAMREHERDLAAEREAARQELEAELQPE